jgi:hypothetical protein
MSLMGITHHLTLTLSSDLLDLLNKVITTIDPSQEANKGIEDPAKTAERISEFLKIMNYPSNFEQ